MITFFQSINNAAGLTLQVAYPWNLFAYLHLFHHWLAVTKMVTKGVLDNVIFSVHPAFFHVLHGERRLNLFRIYVLSSQFQTGLIAKWPNLYTILLMMIMGQNPSNHKLSIYTNRASKWSGVQVRNTWLFYSGKNGNLLKTRYSTVVTPTFTLF